MRPRETELLLLPEDEQAILDAILRDIPGAVVIDSQWESVNRPPIRGRIADAGPIVGELLGNALAWSGPRWGAENPQAGSDGFRLPAADGAA